MKKIALALLFILGLMVPASASAQDTFGDIASDIAPDQVQGIVGHSLPASEKRGIVYDWYIKDLQTEIILKEDSSLNITENIVADCGNALDKHGIFRVLPTYYVPENGKKVSLFVDLESITDFDGNPYEYSVIKDRQNGTLTWKIGSADKTVSGVNNYRIKYQVRNSVRFDNPSFDEFYWNVHGQFWDLEVDHFLANIVFPEKINEKTVLEINKYDGNFGAKDLGISTYKWISPNTIQVESKTMLATGQGVTLSVTFPKGIITPPVLSFWEKYGGMIMGIILVLIPILVFLICFRLWWKHGRDPRLRRSIMPEFSEPGGLTPMEMGAFLRNGDVQASFISAEIVSLAVKGIIKIEEIPKKGVFGSADTKLTIIADEAKRSKLNAEDSLLLNSLFGQIKDGEELLISSLKNSFYKKLPAIKSAVKDKQIGAGLFSKKGFALRDGMIAIGAVAGMGAFWLFSVSSMLGGVILLSALFVVIFGVFMPKRTPEGAELLWKVRGFEMYMKKAEKYRQEFNEKENIFERFLPYAMVFGIVGLWTKKMKEIYGEEYFNNYHPIWYVGALNMNDGVFDAEGFASQLSAISSSMSSTMSSSPSSSGSGGGGFSGGGGGGGGGGGW